MSQGQEALESAIELALSELRSGPTLSAFGIAREDCALVHIDYFHSVDVAAGLLADALAEVRGTDAASILREFAPPPKACDDECCVPPEVAKAARQRHVDSYTNVKEWEVRP